MLKEEQFPPPGPVHCAASSPVKKKAREKRPPTQSGWATLSLPKMAGQSQLATQAAGSVMTWSGSSRRGAWAASAADTRGRCSSTQLDARERPDAQGQGLQDRDRSDHLQHQHLVVVRAVVVHEALDEVEDAEERYEHRLHDVEDGRYLALERCECGSHFQRQELV